MKTDQLEDNQVTLLTDYDIHLFKEGKHFKLYEKLGAHYMADKKGTYFAVWAPSATDVRLIGNFNGWNKESHKMSVRWDNSGIWEIFVPGLGPGEYYKYAIRSHAFPNYVEKFDPFAFHCENPPGNASIVWDLKHKWSDKRWLNKRKRKSFSQPYSVYEVHLGSWRRITEDGNRFLSYREVAQALIPYVKEMGFTHVEFLPVMEHPFYGSWGYQTTSYFAPTSRYGTPQDLMFLINELHKAEIGVIMDWVPSHFPGDEWGLYRYDGTHLFEHEDSKKGYHPDWSSYIFNYGRFEVKSFLISSAIFWMDKYHVDGLRVDAVASMLYLDYSRNDGEWIPNIHGGKENLEAIAFIKEMNEAVYSEFPGSVTIAEESTDWPNVSKPIYNGGLGFGLKWMMGWMHDALEYFKKEPVHRRFHQNTITFSLHYAFSENFMLPLSHDEVVHGKGSILNKMPGDRWQAFANLRALYALMFTHPGSKLLFMGNEFGQTKEWNHDSSLDWHLLEDPSHSGIQLLVKDLNAVYTQEKCMYENQFESSTFQWIDMNDHQNCVISYLRRGKSVSDTILVIANLTPVPRNNYQIGAPFLIYWRELINTDDVKYGGSGYASNNGIKSTAESRNGFDYSLKLKLPPLSVLIFKPRKKRKKKAKTDRSKTIKKSTKSRERT
ncbi:MAG: 1,4-alpha-glucan branching protein GlgB [Chitinophagales bacterium]|nr:1,4-alpha-glucan branching protein GlgB [Chitinophagales bacterium]